jgi:hypothetical protein
MKKKTFLKENKQLSTGLVVDRVNGVIRNAKICGFESKNNRVYTEEALRNGVHLYEGAPVNIDHLTDGDAHRRLTDRLGKITNPRFVEGVGIVGDFQILVSHPYAEVMFEAAERQLPLGFSHTAEGQVEEGEDGIEKVIKLESVTSCDVVANPATNTTFSESVKSKKKKGTNKMQISEADKAILEESMKKAAVADDMVEEKDDEGDMEEACESDDEGDMEEASDDAEGNMEEADADVSGVDDQKAVGKVSPKLQGKKGYIPKDYVKESHKPVTSKELSNLIEGAGINVAAPLNKVLAKLTKNDAVLVIRSLAEAGMQKTTSLNLKESADVKQLPKNIFAWLKD